MTLVLLWRVPERRVVLRWRGPAGLASAAARDPLAAVAAVIGPPGGGSTAAFPPLAVLADAATPVPANGPGSVAWSTVLAAPVIWDGTVWRTFAFFCRPLAEAPDWIPQGALLVADFANGRYWRQDLGACTVDDLFEENPAWGPFDPETDIVPGIGLTNGPVSTAGNTFVGPVLTSPAYNLVYDSGFTVVIEFVVTTLDPLTGGNYVVAIVEAIDLLGYNAGYSFNSYIDQSGQNVFAQALAGGLYETTTTVVEGEFTKTAGSFDATTGTALISHLGVTMNSLTVAGDYSAVNSIVLSALVNSDGSFTGNATIGRVTFYPKMDQAALNALTVPILDFTSELPGGASLTRASSGTYYDAAGTMQTAAADEARFDYDPVTHSPRGLMIEPARTNLVPHSAALATFFSNTVNVSFADNLTAAPDGTTTAEKIVEASGTDRKIGYQTLATASVGTSYTMSVFMKQAERTGHIAVAGTSSPAQFGAAYDLTSGATGGTVSIGAPPNTRTAISPGGAGFYRCEISKDAGGSADHIEIGPSDVANPAWAPGLPNPQYAGDGSSGVYTWGLQFEQGAQATSYIPTSGGAATRAEDQLSLTAPPGVTTAHCTIEGGTVEIPVTPGPLTLRAADFGGPVWLQGIVFS